LESNVVRNPATSAATTKQQIKKQKLLLLLTMLVMVGNRHLLHPPTGAVKTLLFANKHPIASI
jgi:hypothetical protein